MGKIADMFKEDATRQEVIANAETRISAARIVLYQTSPFFGSVVARLIPMASDKDITMGVMANGRLAYSPEFISSMSLYQLAGCMSHEALHLIGDVFGRCMGRDGRLWNCAHDYAINPLVLESGLELPDGCLISEEFKDMSAEEIYELLMKEEQNKKSGNQSKKGSGRDKNNPLGQPGTGCADHNDPENQSHTQNGGMRDDGTIDGMTPEDWKAVIAEAAEYARQQGKMPAGLNRYLGELFNPVFDWKTVLARATYRATNESMTTWRRPSRRAAAAGVYLPGRIRLGHEATIAIDTSGSIDGDLLKRFATESEDIMKKCGAKVTVYCCDAEIASEIEASSIHEVEFKGGGGTSFIPVFQRIAERTDKRCRMLVYFTDLMGSFPVEVPPYPVIWCVPEQYAQYATEVPFGTVIYVK